MVNTFVYDTQIPSWLGPQVEEVVRHDVGSATALPFEWLDVPHVAPGAGEPRHDLRHILGLEWTPLGAVRIRLPWPHDATLTADLVQFGLATYVGSLRYAIELGRAVDSNATFERDQRRGGPTFVGGAAASRLNRRPDLIRRTSAILRENFFAGTIWVKGAGCGMTLERSDGGATVRLWTYSRMTDLLASKPTTDAGEALEIGRIVAEIA
jgi:hypothetical protein